jgi:hypothetical protein
MNTISTSLTDFTATTNLLVRADPGSTARGAIIRYFTMFALLALIL